tara:strand:- start:1865 stop:2074 length:210 start_codon:yes stop_codon:yes gene_type:complete
MSRKETVDYDRLLVVAEKAELAFWEVVGKNYPEATYGCFPFDAQFEFSMALETAIEIWVDANVPPARED